MEQVFEGINSEDPDEAFTAHLQKTKPVSKEYGSKERLRATLHSRVSEGHPADHTSTGTSEEYLGF
jgi:hypothetical protein